MQIVKIADHYAEETKYIPNFRRCCSECCDAVATHILILGSHSNTHTTALCPKCLIKLSSECASAYAGWFAESEEV